MRNIVLYKIGLLAGFLMFGIVLNGQKPAINLLPSSHHYMHPEPMIDTSSAKDSFSVYIPKIQSHSNKTDTLIRVTEKKLRPQIGPSLDSVLEKEKTRKLSGRIKSKSFPQHIMYLNPIKLFIYITALK